MCIPCAINYCSLDHAHPIAVEEYINVFVLEMLREDEKKKKKKKEYIEGPVASYTVPHGS